MPHLLPNTIAHASHLIRSRELSPVDLAQATLQRIAAFDSALNAFITVTAEAAMASARQAEKEITQGRYRGALHGIPLSLKDNFMTAGVLTTGHSKVFAGQVPAHSATVVEKLNEAGAVFVGKNSLHELAHGGPSFDLPWPPARNPWNTAHFTAGSSSGSAAAVAAGMALGALGTDTGGSIMNPAALCGLVGFKPTFGLVSRHGVIPNCFSLDHCGPIARTVEDCAILLNAIVGHDPRDRSSVAGPAFEFNADLPPDLKGVRIGVVRRFGTEDAAANADVGHGVENALLQLQALGAHVHDVALRPLRDYYDVWSLIEAPETFAIQRQALIDQPNDFGDVFLTRTLIACLIQAPDYMAAQQRRSVFVDELANIFERCDVLVCPGAGPAPLLHPKLAQWPSPNRSAPFTLTGYPMVAVPTGFSAAGLPTSMQIIGKPMDDARLLEIAHAYEKSCGRSQPQVPPDPAGVPAAIEPAIAATTRHPDAEMVSLCEEAARRAGLSLPERPLALFCNAAPRVLEMLERLRAADTAGAEPANIFVA